MLVHRQGLGDRNVSKSRTSDFEVVLRLAYLWFHIAATAAGEAGREAREARSRPKSRSRTRPTRSLCKAPLETDKPGQPRTEMTGPVPGKYRSPSHFDPKTRPTNVSTEY